jgi:polysaccharide export outer membrane protein
LGEVNAPGAYPLSGRETVLDAIINAGGLTEQANEHKMILTRPRHLDEGRTVLPVCFRQIVQLGDTSTNYQISPGDRVYVPSMTILDDIKQTCVLGEGSCPNCRDFGD